MQNQNTFNSVIIGEESLLVRCGEILLNRGHQIQAVVTANRDIAQWASGHQIPTIAPVSGWADQVTAQPFDYLFSIANLSIIPDAVITHPTKQAINFHDGPLPKYAGLYATTWALLNGEDRHGITWHEMTSKVDEGRILKQRTFPLDDHETAQTLNVKCYDMATATFGELVDELSTGRVSYIEQDLSQKSYFGRYKRPDAVGIIRWSQRAAEIVNLVHALDFGPYPNPLNLPKLIIGDQVFAVTKASEGDPANGALHGTVVAVNANGLMVAAADHYVVIEALTTLNGQPVALQDLNISEGERLTTLNAASAESFSQINDQLVRHERYWANLLRSLASVDVPYAEHTANTGAMGYRQHVLSLTDLPTENTRDYLFASFAAYLARLTNSAEFDLGFSDLALRALLNGQAKPFFSQQVPFRVRLNLNDGSVAANVAGLTEQVQHTREKLSYNRDLIARTPDLRARYDNTGVVFPVLLEETDDADNYTPPPGSELIFLVGQNGGHHLIYDPAVYANDKIQRMAQQYQTFLSNLTANPDQALADVSLLASDEYQKIVMDWNATQTDYDRTACVHDQFAAQAAQTPDAVAVVFEDQQLTYRDLNNSANQLGRYLQSLGVGPDVLVGVSVEPSLDMLVSIMGVHKAGGGYVPMDPSYPADRIALMLEDSHVSVLITQEHLLGRLPELPEHVVCIDRDWPQIAQQDNSDFKNAATPENLAYVIYTSGSTGRPKGVMVQHGNVVNFFAGLDQRIDYVPGDTWLAVTSLSFDISVLELFWTLTRGFKVVLYADSRKVSSTGQAVSKYAEKKIDFSLFYFASDEGEGVADKYHLLLEGAKFADTHGFDAVWTPERHFHAFGGLYPNPSVASAAIAAITQNIKIRAGSCVLPLHSPIRVAEEWALVDNISKGRVGIAFAAGWQPNDFVLRPENYADRKEAMFRDIETVKKLWRGETLTFPGPNGDVAVRTLPRPIQPELPIWVTAAGNPETFRMAGQGGFAILTHLLGQTLEELESKIQVYRQGWREGGHPGNGYVTLMLHTFVGEDDDEVREIVREPMKEYLRSSLSLIQAAAGHFPTFKQRADATGKTPQDILNEGVSEQDMDALLNFSFERYYGTSGLFGTPETCLKLVDDMKSIDVDEIACLIDYGIPSMQVMDHLPLLNRVREMANPALTSAAQASGKTSGDYSLPGLIVEHGATHIQWTPSMAQMFIEDSQLRAALGGIKQMLVGGEAFPLALAKELNQLVGGQIINMYGPTETTVWSSTYTVTGEENVMSIGRPIANTSLYVLDPNRHPVPVGVPGELYIGGEGVVRGYYERPDLTAERFVDDPFRGGRMYRTGDLVRFMDDGKIEFLGRMDHQVKWHGYRIELGEIEARMAEVDALREVVAIVREDTAGDKRLVGYYNFKAGEEVAEPVIREHLKTVLPDFMVPSNLIFLDPFPYTPNGKIDRKALPSVNEVGIYHGHDFVAPESDLEERIAEVWREVLNLPQVSIEDNFFDLGGHSLLAVQLHRRLKEAVDDSLEITHIFRYTTIKALTEFLNPADPDQADADLNNARSRAANRRQLRQQMAANRKGRN